MIQLSTQSTIVIGVKLDGYITGKVNLKFTNQYTNEVKNKKEQIPTRTERGSKMSLYLHDFPVGTYIIEFTLDSDDSLLATRLAYISGTDVIGEDDFKAYTTGDGTADIVYPNT